MTILAILDELLFRSKIEAAAAAVGVPVRFASGAGLPPSSEGPWTTAIIDLNLASGDPFVLVQQLAQRGTARTIIGYCSHLQRDLQAKGIEAGCTTVLPRSALVQQLSLLLRTS